MKKVTTVILVWASLGVFSAIAFGQGTCGGAKLKGDFGFASTGFVPEQLQNGNVRFDPIAQVALVNYDGKTSISVKVRVQYHGQVSNQTLNGTYHVQPDCTGIATFLAEDQSVLLTWDFVLVHGGDEIETVAVRAKSASRPMYSLTFSQKRL
jgi:hypothetical protein